MSKAYRDKLYTYEEAITEFAAKEMAEERNYHRDIETTDNSPTTIEDMIIALDNENQRMVEMILSLNKRIDNILISEDSDRPMAPTADFTTSVSIVFRNLHDQLEVMRHNRQKLGDLINRVNL